MKENNVRILAPVSTFCNRATRCTPKILVVVKIPVPIMFETTSAVALTTPSWRRREGLEVMATPRFILRGFVAVYSKGALLVLPFVLRAGLFVCLQDVVITG